MTGDQDRPVRRWPVLANVAVVAAAIVLAVSLLGSCAGDRPTLGSLPPSVPKAGETTTSPSIGTIPEVDDGILDQDDLLGWIATPVGTPAVFDAPADDANDLGIGPKTPAGAPTTFAVVGDAAPEAPQDFPGWYEVALPTRPNGSTGWVKADEVTVAKTPYRVFVELGSRTLRVEQDGSGIFTAEIAIGTDENPTPVNGTYITELIDNVEPDGAYGPFAFGLAMHSDTLSEFGTGDGQVGIHGTNQPDLIGQAVSHGCVRLANDDVVDLKELGLPLGVPVFITA